MGVGIRRGFYKISQSTRDILELGFIEHSLVKLELPEAKLFLYLRWFKNAIIKKSTNNKHWRGCGEKGTLLHSWQECKLVQPLQRTVWRFLKKAKIELLSDPKIPRLGICLEKNMVQMDIFTLMFTAALFIIAKTWKQSKCHQEWIEKMWYIYTMKYYSAIKK